MSAAEGFCYFAGLPQAQCGHCRAERATRARARWPEDVAYSAGWFAMHWSVHLDAVERGLGPTTQSRWRGRCRGCGREWDEGEDIIWSDGESAWICQGCASAG